MFAEKKNSGYVWTWPKYASSFVVTAGLSSLVDITAYASESWFCLCTLSTRRNFQRPCFSCIQSDRLGNRIFLRHNFLLLRIVTAWKFSVLSFVRRLIVRKSETLIFNALSYTFCHNKFVKSF